MEILSPKPFQVIQRRGVQPFRHPHERADRSNGWAPVEVRARTSLSGQITVRVTISPIGSDPTGYPLAPQRLSGNGEFSLTVEDGIVQKIVPVPAGGWYVLTVSAIAADGVVVCAKTGPFGVGEVYLIGGQSPSGNYNDTLKTVTDRAGRVTTLDLHSGDWRIGHDPQPFNAWPVPIDAAGYWRRQALEMSIIERSYSAGTIWPPAMNMLQPAIGVPIGMITVGTGGTSVRDWLPGSCRFQRLAEAATAAGHFRAVLWQQGETDANNTMDTGSYITLSRAVRHQLAQAIGGRRYDWILAKSTHQPNDYDLPDAEAAIRAGIDTMVREDADVVAGPDTDLVRGPAFRDRTGSSLHLTSLGQDAFGALWFATLLAHLNSARNSLSFL